MLFVLGYLSGLITATLIAVLLTYFRRAIEPRLTVAEKQIESIGPRPKGFIIEPESEADEARAAIIARNRRAGKDTKLEDLL